MWIRRRYRSRSATRTATKYSNCRFPFRKPNAARRDGQTSREARPCRNSEMCCGASFILLDATYGHIASEMGQSVSTIVDSLRYCALAANVSPLICAFGLEDNRTYEGRSLRSKIERRRRNAEMLLEHRREGAMAPVSMPKRHVDDLLPMRQLLQRQEQPRMLTPAPKCHPRFL